MIEVLSYPFFQHALIAGLLASIACGLIGGYVVVRRLGYLAGSIAHSAFGGVGIGYFLGMSPIVGAGIFGVISAFLMGIIRSKFANEEDTLIGAVWAVGMGLGVVFLYLTAGYASDLFGFLFGNILLASKSDLVSMAILDAVLMAVVFFTFRLIQAVTFDEEYATVLGLPVFWVNQLLLTLIAITIVILMRVVGIILVISLLTLPAASAQNLVKRLAVIQGVGIVLSALSVTLGVFISYWMDLPTSPVIVFVAVAVYLGSLGYRRATR